jgi:hypothetical protein
VHSWLKNSEDELEIKSQELRRKKIENREKNIRAPACR